MNTKKLILAMSPVDSVLEDLRTGSKTLWDEKCHQQEQDAFANLMECCWNEFGPSERYLKRLVQKYVSSLERSGNEVESDLLSELVFRLSLCKNTMPDANESCYLSFQLPRSCPVNEHECDANYDWLRIRVFPYHNDVALRLWEAGAALAEFFVDHPLMLRGKDIIELGAGVGLTGLAIAACCNPSSITMTDCTDICRTNLEHNLEINRRWLSKHGFSSDCINQVGLSKSQRRAF
jgi:Lysine methyltransferase